MSYVRLELPVVAIDGAGGSDAATRRAEGLREALAAARHRNESSAELEAAIVAVRRYACALSSAIQAAGRPLADAFERDGVGAAPSREAIAFAERVSNAVRQFRGALRDGLGESIGHASTLAVAANWSDEYVSMVVESTAGLLARALDPEPHSDRLVPVDDGSPRPYRVEHVDCTQLRHDLTRLAVEEAAYRRGRGWHCIVDGEVTARSVEHVEFVRHMRKRFVTSVLWLAPEILRGARVAGHVVAGLAAGVAMAIAVLANARWLMTMGSDLFRYGMIAVLAYMVQDRTKAVVQGTFAGWIARVFPDRRWRIRDGGRKRTLAHVTEKVALLWPKHVPAEVAAVRGLGREHRLEEHAQPERVIWHEKTVHAAGGSGAGEAGVTEVLRMSLGHWLEHVDEPKSRIAVADPDGGTVRSVIAPRVYNVNIVYRFAPVGTRGGYKRVRAVVSRKGIVRFESPLGEAVDGASGHEPGAGEQAGASSRYRQAPVAARMLTSRTLDG